MSNIVNSLKKNQKIILLGFALAVISLYILPIDQILAQSDNGGKNGKIQIQSEDDKCKEGKDKKHEDDCYRITG